MAENSKPRRALLDVNVLIALAVANDGVLVTFESAIAATSAVVRGAMAEHVLLL